MNEDTNLAGLPTWKQVPDDFDADRVDRHVHRLLCLGDGPTDAAAQLYYLRRMAMSIERIERAMAWTAPASERRGAWRPRAGIRRLNRSPDGRRQFCLGVRIGYWPCLYAQYIQVAVFDLVLDCWVGFASYQRTHGSGDRP